MHQNNMIYSTSDCDSMQTMNTGGSLTYPSNELFDYATTYPRMLDTSYFGAEESWDIQATLGSMPSHLIEDNLQPQKSLLPHHEQQINHFGSTSNSALNTLDTSASVANSQALLSKERQSLYWSPPPANYQQSPTSNDLPPSEDLMDINYTRQHPNHTHWYQASSSASSSPSSYQELLSLDICPISPPNLPYPCPMVGKSDHTITTSKTQTPVTRRHTVSTACNNARMIGQLDVNHQQMKIRKMMKAKAKQQRPRSLSQIEQPTHHSFNQLDPGYPLLGPWATSPSSSCEVSCCGSPLSAEFLLNEQRLDWMMDPMYSKTTTPATYTHMISGQSDSVYQISPSPSSAPSFSPPLQLSACTSFSPAQPVAHYVPNNSMIGVPLAYNGTDLAHDDDMNATGPQIDDGGDDDDAPYICQWADCAMEFEKQPQLIAHVKTLHIGTGKSFYQCRWNGCQRGEKPFTKRHKMHNHLRVHTGERPYICMEEGCGKRFARPDSLSTHGKIHTNIRPYECQHENCDKAYYHLRSLRKHEKSHKV